MKFEIDARNEFMLDDARFHIDTSPGPHRRPSDDHAYTLVKTEDFLDIYRDIADVYRPRTILELGVFQGGSFVLLDKMFRPERMSAVDISKRQLPSLLQYVDRIPHRYLHLETSQTDESVLRHIVDEEFEGNLDMVVDDCSHRYELTRRSFELLFPLLSPGGVYIIEDWCWAHVANYQRSDHPLAEQPALTNLLFELIALQGSAQDLIKSITIHRQMAIIRKGSDMTCDLWEQTLMRGRTLSQI